MFNLKNLAENPNFWRISRISSFIAGVIFICLTIAFLTRSPLARSVWPWSYTTLSNLSYLFLGSITIAIAAPALWIAATGELAASVGGAINLGVTFGGCAIFMLQTASLNAGSAQQRVMNGAIFSVLIVLSMILIFVVSRGLKYHNSQQMPRTVRTSFAFFAVFLSIAGVLLVLKQPVFPWRLSGEASIIYGWIFLGAVAYFAYGWYRPYWSNAAGQLAGFLAYDLVLILPFLAHFSTVEPEYLWSLSIYVVVIIYSGALAIYYLFFHPATRVWSRAAAVQPAAN